MKLILFIIFLFSLIIHPYSLLTEEISKPRVALVLSGGGAKGLAHIGVLKVLEDMGIKPDIITGTSMGSVVGGLYAIGYSAREIEKITLSQDWDEMLLDKISRRSISIEEKNDFEKYVGSFPIEKFHIKLPKGLVTGQNVSALISRLTLSAHHINDFNELLIPFRCIATDIETGEEVVFSKGFLPDAIRASMSIPSAFTPVVVNDRLLIDGGLVRNLPASVAREMGADIVIGVDVGNLLKDRDELTSLMKIMEQSMGLQSIATTIEERKLCDILILPDMQKYGMLSFTNIDSLIAKGEEAALSKKDELAALAEMLKKYTQEYTHLPILKMDSVYVNDVKIIGLNKVSKNLIIGKLNLKENVWINPEKIDTAIERLYGSNYFERVTYQLEPANLGVILKIIVIEKTDDLFRFGFHYDSDLKSSVLLNLTYRNKLIEGSRLTLDLNLSENVGYRAAYFIHTGWKPGFGFGISSSMDNLDALIYDETESLRATYDYSKIVNSAELRTIFSNSFSLGIGFKYESTRLKARIIPLEYENFINDSEWFNDFNYFSYLFIDTLDRFVFPHKGVRLYSEANFIRNCPDKKNEITDDLLLRFSLEFQKTAPLSSKFTVTSKYWLGSISGENHIVDQEFYLGGMTSFRQGLFPLMGTNFMKIDGRNAQALLAGFQYELMSNHFIILKANMGEVAHNPEDLFNFAEMNYGIGLTYGILFPFGPIDLTIIKNPVDGETTSFLNIGYSFYQ